MARFVQFNGLTLFHPGGLSKIDASNIIPVGLTASGIVGIIGEADGGPPGVLTVMDDGTLAGPTFTSGALPDATRIAFDPSNDERINGGAFRVIAYKVNKTGASRSSLQLPGATALISDTVAAGSTTTVINLTTGGLTVNAHKNRWLLIGTEQRKIVSNAASTVTVAPGFSVAPVATTVVKILNSEILLTSLDYGLQTNQITVEVEAGATPNTSIVTVAKGSITNLSPELGGQAYLEVKYVGGAIPANGSGTIFAATTSTITLTVASAPSLNAFAGMVLQFADGTQRLITGNTAANPTIITLDAAHVITTAQAAAFVTTSAAVRNVTQANVSIAGASGVATGMTSAVLPVADNLSITFSANQTLKQLVDYINGNTNYQATIPAGINGDTTLMASFDFGTRATAVDCRFDDLIDPADKGTFRRDLQVIIDWFNGFSTLVSATRANTGTTEGGQLPAPTLVAYTLAGGARGTSSNSDWQDAFDAFLRIRVNHIIPLISQDLVNEGNSSTATFASVAAQLSSHLSEANGIGKSERGGYIGGKLTKTGLLLQASQLNSTDVQLFGQQFTVPNVGGTLVTQPEWSAAVLAAGMRSGAPEIGEPLTFKFIKTTGVTQSTTWDPTSRTDVNALLQGGVMFAESGSNGGFRWVRDLTTYLADDNIVFTDGNTRDAERFISYDLRTGLEDEFTGLKAKPATVTAIRTFVVDKMKEYLDDSIIVPSLDPETETTLIPEGFRKLKVKIKDGIANIDVEVFIVTGITFELTTIALQLPVITA